MRLALEGESGSPAPLDGGFRESVATWFREYVESPSFRAWIAHEDGRPVGVGGMVVVARPPYTGNSTGLEGLVTSMYTVPGRRGGGIGATLLEAMLATARELGVRRLVLYSSEGARSLYRRFGFTDDVERGAPMHRWVDEQRGGASQP